MAKAWYRPSNGLRGRHFDPCTYRVMLVIAIGLDAKFTAAHASPTSFSFASANLRRIVTHEQGAATLKRSRAAHD